ncbi:MAG: M48 family metallopeptidase [Proteobacteria bacterium]|nr:M48 family metallopeptidase [Pseudomonadota bacterium]
MSYFNPSRRVRAFAKKTVSRGLSLLLSLATAFSLSVHPAAAQIGGLPLIRDTEMERVLKGYEDPILKVAGLDPAAVRIYIVNDPSINAFVAEGQNIFVNTGLFMQLQTPNQVIGVLAHETGHMAGGHLTRGTDAIKKAAIPMLISMVVGIAAMALGAGDVGQAAIIYGQQIAQAQFFQFSRTQEATADQMGQRFLKATHQSGDGMLEVFEKLANEEAMSASYRTPYASDHPASRERIDLLQRLADASPYKDIKDSPETMHQFQMIQAKLAGYLSQPAAVFNRYPPSDTSEEARYARAMAYFRKPDMQKALAEIDSLVKEEPNNPYFQEVLGQIYVEMAQPEKGIGPYQKSVNLLPDAPLLRVSLAAAQIACEQKCNMTKAALDNLQRALVQENDNSFAWYESAQAYSSLGNEPMADLATAEQAYALGALPRAAQFATYAARKLPKGSPDWQRATDIMAVAGPESRQR